MCGIDSGLVVLSQGILQDSARVIQVFGRAWEKPGSSKPSGSYGGDKLGNT